MMTELKWPGFLELPLLLLFMLVVTLVAFVLLEANGSRTVGDSCAEPSTTAPKGSESK